MATLLDKEAQQREQQQVIVGPLDLNVSNTIKQCGTVLATSGCKKKRKQSAQSEFIESNREEDNNDTRQQQRYQSSENLVHLYNAIRLTNYYTNLLSNKQKQTKCDKNSSMTAKTGANWRTKQLAQQIPYQDIKLLAASASPSSAESRSSSNTNPAQPTSTSCTRDGFGQSVDEIKFIRNQRKVASQFKASLYYLNPMQAPAKASSSSNGNSWLKSTSTPSLLLGAKSEANQANTHHCFKVSSLTPNLASSRSDLFTFACFLVRSRILQSI